MLATTRKRREKEKDANIKMDFKESTLRMWMDLCRLEQRLVGDVVKTVIKHTVS
jgi:hypothetical protein